VIAVPDIVSMFLQKPVEIDMDEAGRNFLEQIERALGK
jgi:hypothetical protein